VNLVTFLEPFRCYRKAPKKGVGCAAWLFEELVLEFLLLKADCFQNENNRLLIYPK